MNLANKLTIFRMILVPFFVIVGYLGTTGVLPGEMLGIPTYLWIMNIIFIIASITDKLDGYIARSKNMVTTFGKFLDPLADKVLVISGLICFVQMGLSDAVVVVIIVAREFLVTSLRLVAVDNGNVIAASGLGKIKTALTMTAMVGVMLLLILKDFAVLPAEVPLFLVSEVLLWVAVVLTIISGVDYLVKNRSSINTKK